jgi:hypothetical protein
LSELANWLGFRVVVTDDRPEFATHGWLLQASWWIRSRSAKRPISC